MTITSNDIKLFQAQDNTDNDSGGGSRTSAEIVDGDINNLFPDISRIDTVSGDVALRKVFPTVYTANRDVYYGAHEIIRKKPTDPKVSALLFHSDDPFDTRADVQNKIESYVVASYLEQFYLFGNHVVGSKSVTFLQDLSSIPPVVSEVYLLSDPSGYEQYIRIVDITPQIINLNWSNGTDILTFQRRRIICEIEQALEFAFVGSAFDPMGQEENTCDTYATQIADAAKFYGTRNLIENALINDVSVKVDSIYEALVPSSKAQSPLINQVALKSGKNILPTVTTTLTINESLPGGSWIGKLGFAVTPGTLNLANIYSDDGNGNIVLNTEPNIPLLTIDYTTGEISNSNSLLGGLAGGVSITCRPAIAVDSFYQFTGSILITNQNQSVVYVKNLSPIPSEGTIYIDYRSMGKWYRLESNYDGSIGGDVSIGAGTINDNNDGTGTLSLTLGSLPDIDSSLIVTWGSAKRVIDRSAEAQKIALYFDLGKGNIDPISFSMVANNNSGTPHTITSDADGILTDTIGVITGTLDYIKGGVYIFNHSELYRFESPTSLNLVNITFDYAEPGIGVAGEYKLKTVGSGQPNQWDVFDLVNHTFEFSIGETISRSSLRISTLVNYNYSRSLGNDYIVNQGGSQWVHLVSDATGVLREFNNPTGDIWGSAALNGDIVIIPPDRTIQVPAPTSNGGFDPSPRYNSVLAKGDVDVSSFTSIEYYSTTPLSYPLNHVISDTLSNITSYRIQLVEYIAGEVAFRALFNSSSSVYNFYSENGLIFNRSGYINNHAQVGTIDYVSGLIEINYIDTPSTFYCKFYVLGSDEVSNEDRSQYIFDFRTSSTSLIPSSLQLRYHLVETGSPLRSATTDQNGIITGTGINNVNSYVDTETGMVHIEFSTPAYAESIIYDAVAEIVIPIDPELLGLNPVRLPKDGRVPIFEPGRHIVIFDEVTTPTTNLTPLANDVETLARSGQSYIEVIDVNGKRLNPVQYIADKTLGTVTFSPTLVLEDKYQNVLTGPFYIIDRVEDMVLATEVQINGEMTISAPLSHNYTANNSKVASALVWGDTGSRVYNLFSQEIWNSGNPVWSDTLIGDPTTAQYDDINYPIQVNNQSSTSGRWAIIFLSSSTVMVAHERLGIVAASVSISLLDVAPINPATGSAYFTMDRNGFGAGWVTNNVIRFNTDSGDQNCWVIRTVQSGALSELTDSIELEIRGDAN